MRVHLPGLGRSLVERCLVPAHRIREVPLEQAVVAAEEVRQHRREVVTCALVELGQARRGALRDHQRFERPGGPERDDHQPLARSRPRPVRRRTPGRRIEEQTPASCGQVRALRGILAGTFAGEGRARPDLPVGMRIGGTHRHATVLEHLDPTVFGHRARTSGRPTGRRPCGRPTCSIRPRVRSCRGEKHTTRQRPCSPSARRSPSSTTAIDVSGRSAE